MFTKEDSLGYALSCSWLKEHRATFSYAKQKGQVLVLSFEEQGWNWVNSQFMNI